MIRKFKFSGGPIKRSHLAKVTRIQGPTLRNEYSNKLFLEDKENRSHLAKVSLIQDLNTESICLFKIFKPEFKTKVRIYETESPPPQPPDINLGFTSHLRHELHSR